jgi:hypothetical protein
MDRRVDSRRINPAPTSPEASGGHSGALPRVIALPRGIALTCIGFLGALALAATPALAAKTDGRAVAKPAKQRFSLETPLTPFQPSISDSAKFSFTASGNNPATSRLQTLERAFRFTPSGQSDNRKALSLGVSTRVIAAAPERSRATMPVESLASLPASYNVDLSVGWKGFAVNTGFGHVEPGPGALLAGARDSVDLGVSYRGKNWRTSLQGTAEKGSLLAFAPLERRYSVELGGAYAIAPRVSVNGGVRYKLAPLTPSLLDPNRDDQAVYLGTNVAF